MHRHPAHALRGPSPERAARPLRTVTEAGALRTDQPCIEERIDGIAQADPQWRAERSGVRSPAPVDSITAPRSGTPRGRSIP